MSQNRGRNIFTLGNFRLGDRSQSRPQQPQPDLFARDPFKVQSYNFRYAERPVYPVMIAGRIQRTALQGGNSANKLFNTFFYNHDFATASTMDASTLGRRESNSTAPLSLSPLQELRRRRYMQSKSLLTARRGLIGPYATTSGEQSPRRGQSLQSQSSFGGRSYVSGSSMQTRSSLAQTRDSTTTQRSFIPVASSKVRTSQLQAAGRDNSSQRSGASNCSLSPFDSCGRLRPLLATTNTNAAASSNRAAMSQPDSPTTRLALPTVSHVKHDTAWSSGPHSPQSLMTVRRSLSSGCGINIKIRKNNSTPGCDNITIDIEAEPSNQPAPQAATISRPSRSDIRDNVTLNIKSKPSKLNLQPSAANNPLNRPSGAKGTNSKLKLNIAGGPSSVFMVDKQLSKFCLGNRSKTSHDMSKLSIVENNNSRLSLKNNAGLSAKQSMLTYNLASASDKAKERSRVLSSIYAPSSSPKKTARQNPARPSATKTSDERVPSLVPWRDTVKLKRAHTSVNLKEAKRPDLKTSSTSKTSLSSSQVGEKTQQVNTQPYQFTLKRLILHKFHSSKHWRQLCSQAQLFPAQTALPAQEKPMPNIQIAADSNRMRRICLPRLRRSPLNININVFAERLKMFNTAAQRKLNSLDLVGKS